MKRQDKSLLEVFPGAFRDPDLAEIAAQLSVRQIRISKEQRRANIYASANTFYSPYWVLDLKKTISSHLDNRLKINIEIQYPFEDPMEHVEDYWDVLLEKIRLEHPFLYTMLRSASLKVTEDKLTVQVSETAVSILEGKNMGAYIGRSIQEELGLALAVQFQGRELTEEEQRTMEENRVKRETQLLRQMAERREEAPQDAYNGEPHEPLPWEEQAVQKAEEPNADRVLFGKAITGTPKDMSLCTEEAKGVVLRGDLTSYQTREIKGGKIILTMSLTDYNAAMTVKAFVPEKEFRDGVEPNLAKGRTLTVKGRVQEDTFLHEMVLMANHIMLCCAPLEVDEEKKKALEAMIVGRPFEGEPRPLRNIENVEGEVIVRGEIILQEEKEIKSGKVLVQLDITDYTGSITVKAFMEKDAFKAKKGDLKKGKAILVKGHMEEDSFTHQRLLMADAMIGTKEAVRKYRVDTAQRKRIELHAHTQISEMDAVDSPTALITQAANWGHSAVAITDHGVVQAFPEAMDAAEKTGIKVIYGVEAYLVDDLQEAVIRGRGQGFSEEYVVFDIETTGFNKEKDRIIEIGAVKIRGEAIIDRFSQFVNPQIPIPKEITELTSITQEDVADADPIDMVLPRFLEWAGDGILTAHNAAFDTGFIERKALELGLPKITNTILDTLELSRGLYELKRFTLDSVAKHLGIELKNHHRAVDDAEATAQILLKCFEALSEHSIDNLARVNEYIHDNTDVKRLRAHHAIILVKNLAGLRNLYELVSIAHLKYFYRTPRIPKSEFMRLREGLLIGSACEAGELYQAVLNNDSPESIERLVNFYDYLEIQPLGNNEFMLRNRTVGSREELMDINRRIVQLGETYNKPVVATCDVHFLEPEDEIYRRIIMAAKHFDDADRQPPLYFRTTDEMLEEFSYFGEAKAEELVIDNPLKISEQIEVIKPIPDGTFTPEIEGANDELVSITHEKAESMYGKPLPGPVEQRLDRELKSIIKNGFASLYIIAQRLVWKSVGDGYLVGSRGSVGSSFVATMAGITEVNPLPPHYYCKKCQYSEFESPEIEATKGKSGFDLPDKVCPNCGEMLTKDGQEIPFETFLGFDGDKEPDIDLNFSGEYQPRAHAFTEELFGQGHVFRAGTMGSLAEKTAYGFVKKYLDEHNKHVNNAEISRLVAGCTGVKRTTGQHPGGQMVVPKGYSIYQFCPVQHPANDTETDIITTHFDYHQLHGRLLKLDILGHDDPTMIRMLEDLTGVKATDIPLDDKKVMSLFLSTEALEVTPEEINSPVGSYGIPEYGTNFVRQMLVDTKPQSFSDLVRISGLSHGTDVWNNNAKDLIGSKTATISECICCRDDIMTYLIHRGMESLRSFKIMESVRKGKGLKPEDEAAMREANVPEWYIASCKKIKYLFPKAHAAAYVTMSLRVAYYKVYYKEAYYAAFYTVRADGFDYELMCMGVDRAREAIDEIDAKGKEATAKEKDVKTILELVVEMYCRRVEFEPMDLYRSHGTRFQITEEGRLLPPFNALQGMGVTAAQSIEEARGDGPFTTIEDFLARTKVSRTIADTMKKLGIFGDLPETDQLSLF